MKKGKQILSSFIPPIRRFLLSLNSRCSRWSPGLMIAFAELTESTANRYRDKPGTNPAKRANSNWTREVTQSYSLYSSYSWHSADGEWLCKTQSESEIDVTGLFNSIETSCRRQATFPHTSYDFSAKSAFQHALKLT